MWPTVLNTALGVRSIPKDYLNVAKVLQLSRWKTFTKVLLPAALPYMFTGFRLSLGIAWLVIVAVEMLTGTPGIGGFLWQEYNSLIYEHIILCILAIGVVGIVLDRMMKAVEDRLRVAEPVDHGLSQPRQGQQGLRRGKNRSEVLQDVSLTVNEGEFVAIVGYSGAGKTTLISMVAGLLAPDSGSITMEGCPITGPGPRARRRLPELLVVALAVGVREHPPRRRPGLPGLVARRKSGPAPRSSWTWSSWATPATSAPTSSRAACASGWRWRGPWP